MRAVSIVIGFADLVVAGAVLMGLQMSPFAIAAFVASAGINLLMDAL